MPATAEPRCGELYRAARPGGSVRRTSTAAIQLRVGELRQLFNSIDPSPFRERDLDPDCEEFIVSWAREFSPDRPIAVDIRLDREEPDSAVLAEIGPAVRRHFEREASLQQLRLRRLLREGRFSLAVGLVSLVLCIGAATLVPTQPLGAFSEILRESLLIAGWVVMWHPLEVLLYGLWPVLRERRLLERLASAEVSLSTPARGTAAASRGDR
jgi:hypothetical protein